MMLFGHSRVQASKVGMMQQGGSPENKLTGCVLMTRQGEGMAKQRDKT
jgi:anti-sigma-K factor RskA